MDTSQNYVLNSYRSDTDTITINRTTMTTTTTSTNNTDTSTTNTNTNNTNADTVTTTATKTSHYCITYKWHITLLFPSKQEGSGGGHRAGPVAVYRKRSSTILLMGILLV